MDGAPCVEPLRARRIPMLLAAGSFAAGILLARGRWHSPFALFWTSLLLLALTAWAQRKAPRTVWAPVLVLWLAAGCWCAQIQAPVARQVALLL